MVRAATQNGLPGTSSAGTNHRSATTDRYQGDYDVPSSPSHTKLDGEGNRASAERGVHMAKPIPELKCPSSI